MSTWRLAKWYEMINWNLIAKDNPHFDKNYHPYLKDLIGYVRRATFQFKTVGKNKEIYVKEI